MPGSAFLVPNNTERPTNMATDCNSQKSYWPTNMAAKTTAPNSHREHSHIHLYLLHLHSDCTHLDSITLITTTVYKETHSIRTS